MTVMSGYQDGWNTRGWTAQWANLPNATPTSPSVNDLALPTGLVGLPVTGKWNDMYGPSWGHLFFTPSVPMVIVNDTEVELTAFEIYLDNGALPTDFKVPIPDTGYTPAPATWTWNVTGRVGPKEVEYTIPVPNAFNPFDLIANGVPTTPAP